MAGLSSSKAVADRNSAPGVDCELVVATAEVLDERVPSDHHARRSIRLHSAQRPEAPSLHPKTHQRNALPVVCCRRQQSLSRCGRRSRASFDHLAHGGRRGLGPSRPGAVGQLGLRVLADGGKATNAGEIATCHWDSVMGHAQDDGKNGDLMQMSLAASDGEMFASPPGKCLHHRADRQPRARDLRDDGRREPSRCLHEPISLAARGKSRRLVGMGRGRLRRGPPSERTDPAVGGIQQLHTGAT